MGFFNINLEQKKSIMEKTAPSPVLNYKFSQVFGYKGPNQKILEEDIITALKFDSTGKHIAVGDKAGRIIVFHTDQLKKSNKNYNYLTQFQSHINQFDPLRSLQVEEQIKGIEWLQPQGKYNKIVTTNERTIKLWKLFEKTDKKVIKSAGNQLALPKLQEIETGFFAQPQKVFPNKHLNPINTITKSNNEQYLLASDQSQILLWNLQKPEKPFMMLNPPTVPEGEQNKNLITCSKYHPQSDSLFLYGREKGLLEMVDLRVSPSAQSSCISFGAKSEQKNYLLQLMQRNSSLDFLKSGKYVISRDFLAVKLWDVCSPKKPLLTFTLNDGLKPKLCQMTQNEAIFDNFFVTASANSNQILTGSYNNWFHMLNPDDGVNAQYELSYKKNTVVKEMTKGAQVGKLDYLRKVKIGDLNPKNNSLVVASLNCFFIYSM